MGEKITSTDVRNALKLRYEPMSHALLWEVANGTGAGAKRYADAVAIGLWPSHGHRIEGIEIKVSRSDFLGEMKNPTKSQAVFRYCDLWWLACPKDMVKPDELPPTWGLLELMENGTLRTRVKAPKLNPEPSDRGFMAALLRRHAGRDEEMNRQFLQQQTEAIRQKTNAEVERQVQRLVATRTAEAERGMATINAVKEATGLDMTEWHQGDSFIEAVKLVQKLGGRWDGIADLRRRAASLVEAVDLSGLLPKQELANG